jgi:hypothetical protein
VYAEFASSFAVILYVVLITAPRCLTHSARDASNYLLMQCHMLLLTRTHCQASEAYGPQVLSMVEATGATVTTVTKNVGQTVGQTVSTVRDTVRDRAVDGWTNAKV